MLIYSIVYLIVQVAYVHVYSKTILLKKMVVSLGLDQLRLMKMMCEKTKMTAETGDGELNVLRQLHYSRFAQTPTHYISP